MPSYETESLVLKSYNLAEADRIVVFFTRDHGVVRGVAKGAKRLKSRFGSTLEPFSTVRLEYFQKEDRELVSIQNVELIRSFFAPAAVPEFLHTYAYIAELLLAFAPPHDPNETLYRMINACLEAGVDGPGNFDAVRLYFEIWLLRLGGYLPDWSRCGDCNREFAAEVESFLSRDFHLLCGVCRRNQGLAAISAVDRSVFFGVHRLPPADFMRASESREASVELLSVVMRRIIGQVLGKEIASGGFDTAGLAAVTNAA